MGRLSAHLAIHILALTNPEHQYRNPLVLDIADQPIITHAISPQPALVAVQRFPPLAGVLRRLYPLPQESDDRLLGRAV